MMKGYSSSCINVCVIGEFISTINLANFLHNQNGIRLSHFEVENEFNFSWLIDLEKEIFQSDVLIVASDDVNLNCTIILTAFKNNTPVILFDEQTYFFAGDYLKRFGPLLLASDTVSGTIGRCLSKRNVFNDPVVMGLTLPCSIFHSDYTNYIFSLGILCNTYKGNMIQGRLIGMEAGDKMDAALRLTQMNSSSIPICDYLIVSNEEPQIFILDNISQNLIGKEYSFYSSPIENSFNSLLADIDSILEMNKQARNSFERKYNICARLRQKLLAGEKITMELLHDKLEPQVMPISESFDTIPWPLLVGAEMRFDVETGQSITFKDVEIDNSLALGLWQEMLKNNFGRRYNTKGKKVDR